MTAHVQRTGVAQVDVGLQLALTIVSLLASGIALFILIGQFGQPQASQ